MNTKLTLKNFRVFDNKQGGTFNLAPITILTGCNSSGKSSVVKALLLLKDFFQELSTNKITDCKLNFGNTLAKLGRYDLALNHNSRKDGKMCFAYTISSKKLGEDILVKIWVSAKPNDTLNNGWLNHITISKVANNAIVLDVSFRQGDKPEKQDLIFHKINLRTIRKNFIKSVYGYLLMRSAKFAIPTGQSEDGRYYKYKKEDLEECNQICNIISNLLPKEETEVMAKEASQVLGVWRDVDGTSSKYSRDLYINLRQDGILFPLPILKRLVNVKKRDFRNFLYNIICEAGRKEEYAESVEPIISAFETSQYDDFMKYYKAKEQEFLCFTDCVHTVKTTCEYQVNETFYISSEVSPIGKCYGADLKFSNLLNLNDVSAYDIRDELKGANFGYIYSILTELSRLIDPKGTTEYINEHIYSISDGFEQHKVFEDFCEYFDDMIKEALSPEQFRRFKYVGDSAIEIKRVYTIEQNDEFGDLLTRYIELQRKGKTGKFVPGQFLNKWVKSFNLGDRIEFEYTSDGYGILVRLYKDTNDKIGRLLVDEGYGITKLVTILINIELSILTKDYKYVTLAIEEPENHLHPRYQAMLAEMFADAYKIYGIHFIVETHSEYMVRKLQTLVAKKELTPAEVSLQYLYNPDIELRPKGEPQVKDIPIGEDGILKDTFGPGFMDEADNLAMDILTIKAMS